MINVVRIISSAIENGIRSLKFKRMGNSDVQTSREVAPFGSDTNPVKDMTAIYATSGVKGKTYIIGYINTQQLAAIGEHRIYSTDTDGGLSTFIWLKNDGSMHVGGDQDNMVRFSKLEQGFNALKADLNALITKYNSHVHTGNLGAPTTPTATTQSSSTASIADAKINEIKTL